MTSAQNENANENQKEHEKELNEMRIQDQRREVRAVKRNATVRRGVKPMERGKRHGRVARKHLRDAGVQPQKPAGDSGWPRIGQREHGSVEFKRLREGTLRLRAP